MSKKYLIAAAVGTVIVTLSAGIGVLLLRRSHREPLPVAAAPPRVEQVAATASDDSAPQAS